MSFYNEYLFRLNLKIKYYLFLRVKRFKTKKTKISNISKKLKKLKPRNKLNVPPILDNSPNISILGCCLICVYLK